MVLSGRLTAQVFAFVLCAFNTQRTSKVGGFLSASGFKHPEHEHHARHPAESNGPSGSSAAPKPAVMSKVEVPGTPGKCLDGSPPVYYISRGRQMHKWVVFLQGGDWCTRHLPIGVKDSRRSCPMRSEADGSSWRMKPLKSLKAVGKVYGPLSASRDRNPMMHDWNKVYLQNCDGSSFASSVAAGPIDIQGRRLYFRGLQIMEGVIEHLLEHQGLGEATDLVLAGCSAGGLAVYLHVDRWREALAAKASSLGRSSSSLNVVGLADSGFFLRGGKQGGASGDCDYEARMRFLFSELNAAAAVPAPCAAAYAAPGESYKCMFAEHLLPHVRTPVFTLQSVSDGWQLEWIACNATAGTLDAKLHRSSMLSAMESALGIGSSSSSNNAGHLVQHGAFIDACQHHCHCYNDIVIDNTSQAQAFERFYMAVTEGRRRGNSSEAFVWKDLKCGIRLSTDGTAMDCPYKPFSWEF